MFWTNFGTKGRFYSKNLKVGIFQPALEKFREDLKKSISTSATCASILEGIRINLGSGKKEASLKEIGNLSTIDSNRAEVTTFDSQFTKSAVSSFQSAGLNLAVSVVSPTKIMVSLPKSSSSSRSLMIDQLKKNIESLKSEIREIRRKEINRFRASTKDKDDIKKFETDIQNNYESVMSELDKELENVIKKFTK